MFPSSFKPNFAISDLVRNAQKRLPPNLQQKPWAQQELNHGVAPLTSDEALDSYLAAYGEMHSVKLEFAFASFPIHELKSSFEIYDWGCGQGLASIEFLHYLKKNGGLMPSRLTLVEPSQEALKRARINTAVFLSENKIRTAAMRLPSDNGEQHPNEIDDSLFFEGDSTIVHLFSNVLDVPGIDLKKMAEYITSIKACHYIVCVGPCNAGETRIDAFSRYFNLAAESIFAEYRDPQFAHLRSGHPYTCTILGFRADCRVSEEVLCRYPFYPPVQYHCGYRPDILADDSIGDLCGLKYPYAFEILAPFDMGAGICSDPHPIFAVLNNIVSRGLPASASPFLENEFARAFGITKESESLGSIRYGIARESRFVERYKTLIAKVSLATARVQKTILEAMLYGELPLKPEWHVLALEKDVPCCALAFAELAEMFNNLASLSAEYCDLRFPKIKIEVVSPHYFDSALHGRAIVFADDKGIDPATVFDVILDVAIEDLCDPDAADFSRYKTYGRCAFVIRSSASLYSRRKMITTERIRYKRLVNVLEGESAAPAEDSIRHLRYFLNLLFRKKDFRPGQIPILDRALRLESVIGLLPTGGGKSLTYQLAAMLQPGVTLVVDPLVSLMKDQFDGLIKNGIDCCTYINSVLGKDEKEARSAMLTDSQFLFLFLSPERLCIRDFRIRLRDMAEAGVYFAYGVVDEVHCVSEWGHDFRFSYLHLGRNLYSYVLPKSREGEDAHISLFGLTATASFDVLADVERELSGNNAFPLPPDATVRYENTNRLELQYRVIKIPMASKTARKWDVFEYKAEMVPQVLTKTLYDSFRQLSTPESVARIKQRFLERENITDENLVKSVEKTDLNVDLSRDWYSDPGHAAAAIVFCPHRSGTLGVKDKTKQGIASRLEADMNCDVSSFIGGDSLEPQEQFIRNETGIMVATKAFGMGIDKPNIRFTINVNHSGSPEAFVQEAGRAGRDRKMALSVILYSDCHDYSRGNRDSFTVDFGIHKFFHENNFLGKLSEKRVLYYIMQYMDVYCEDTSLEVDGLPGSQVQGLLNMLDSVADGTDCIYYMSYAMQSQDYHRLNAYLTKSGEKPLSPENYYSALSRAIYRMCCIGLIKDYTQDYSGQQFRIVVSKLPPGGYYAELADLMTRYYGVERAHAEAEKAKTYKGNNEIQKCLGFLTDFVYDKIAGKRWQAIWDIEEFCRTAADNPDWLEANEQLKDYLYYYFNSKFAREQYTAPNGEDFSLTTDTDRGKTSSFDIVRKYLRVIDDEISDGGSPKDNIKHLQGAVRLIRRAVTDINPALNLLNVFCILYLNPQPNAHQQQELESNYLEGASELFRFNDEAKECSANLEWFIKELSPEGRGIIGRDASAKLEELTFAAETYAHVRNARAILDAFLKK